jgi:Leucine-rich repeat (LRR) protein
MRIADLALDYNNIVDISPLSEIPGHSGLITLSHNEIVDISALGRKEMNTLDLSHNHISDISPLGGNEIFRLDLNYNNIVDISPLSEIRGASAEITLSHNEIVDISALGGMEIAFLDLSYNNISDISPLATCKDIWQVDLRGNPLNSAAYDVFIPEIEARNPYAKILYDPIPEPVSLAILLVGTGMIFRKRPVRGA